MSVFHNLAQFDASFGEVFSVKCECQLFEGIAMAVTTPSPERVVADSLAVPPAVLDLLCSAGEAF